MKNLIFSFSICLIFISCQESIEDENEAIVEPTQVFEDEENLYTENELGDEFDIDYTQVISAQIGIYQEEALMVVKHYPENENSEIQIEGYYFYVKNQKNLDLEGIYDPIEKRYFLTESYKGEITGYMEFVV